MSDNRIRNRMETPGDEPAISEVHKQAFGGEAEALLLDRLREKGDLSVSMLVDTGEGKIIAHAGFSPVKIGEDSDVNALALAPIAVLPKWQRQGIGTRLIRAALVGLERQAVDRVFVFGEAAYFERFGFSPDLAAPYQSVDNEANLLALDLSSGTDIKSSGSLTFSPAFTELPN